MAPELPGYGHIGHKISKHSREKYTGCYCRPQLQNCFSISRFYPWPHPKDVWSLPCPQHTCTTLHHGTIKYSLTLHTDISSTYSNLAQESERKKEAVLV
jgi:hypothetical protein